MLIHSLTYKYIHTVPFINSLVFIMHGNRDEIVPFFHGEELYLATQPKYRYDPFWVDGAGHNNIELCVRKENPQLFFEKLRTFLRFVKSHPNGIENINDKTNNNETNKETYNIQDHLFCCAKGHAGRLYEDDYGTTTNDNNNRKPMKEYDSSKLTIHTPSKKKKNQEKKC